MSKLLEKYSIDIEAIVDIHWKTQDSTEQSILFYSFKSDDANTVSLFKERIADYKYLITK